MWRAECRYSECPLGLHVIARLRYFEDDEENGTCANLFINPVYVCLHLSQAMINVCEDGHGNAGGRLADFTLEKLGIIMFRSEINSSFLSQLKQAGLFCLLLNEEFCI